MANRHAADKKQQRKEQDGRRHDQMPRDRTRDPDRHESGSGELSMQPGVFRAHLLFDLPGQSRMVCQGGLGSRAEEKWRMPRPHSPCNRREPSRRCNPSMALGRWPVTPCVACAAALRPRWQTGERRPRRLRLHLFRQDYPLDPAAHELVALACRRFEPRPVNLDRAPPVGPDSHPTRAAWNDMRHRRPPHAE